MPGLHNWVPSPGPNKPDGVAHNCSSSTGKVEEGESQFQGHPKSHNQFKASLDCLEILVFAFTFVYLLFQENRFLEQSSLTQWLA